MYYRRNADEQLSAVDFLRLLGGPAYASLMITLTLAGITGLILSLLESPGSSLDELVFSIYAVPWLYLSLVSFTFVVAALARTFEFSMHRHRIADLPWQQAWPWVIAALLGPVAWIGFAISYAKLRMLPAGPHDIVDRNDRGRRDIPEAKPVRPVYVKASSFPAYPSDEAAAAATYTSIRTGALTKRSQQRVEEIDRQLSLTDAEIKRLTERLRELHARRNILRAERQDAVAAAEANFEEVDQEQIEREFNRLKDLPHVIAVQAEDGDVVVIVRAECTYEGKRYDLGDWKLTIGPRYYRLGTSLLRERTRSDWHSGYPAYGGDSVGGGFCFSGRATQLDEYYTSGRYLEAVALAINCITSVNAGDLEKIPSAFKQIK